MARVRCDGVEFGYDEAGSGPVVVLLHGAMTDRHVWDHQFAALAEDHRVIRYDARGTGESGSGAGEFAHHEDLLALLDALDVASATLVGTSMGGARALDATLAAPDRVTALALISSGLSGHSWPAEMAAQARERVHSAVDPARLARYREGTALPELAAFLPHDAEAFAAAHVRWMVPDTAAPGVVERLTAMMREVMTRAWNGTGPPAEERTAATSLADLSRIRVPTLVVNGLADLPWIQQLSTQLATTIPGAHHVDLPQTGHLAPTERPAEVTALLRELLVSTRPAGGAEPITKPCRLGAAL
ncbi:alpha/beta fold hydrolase [Streptomyces sp. 4N509B]|uniref:alpha/beta fold hydrolase n=1 Tax=Streptomyces sp. 4N509B TaxID=3457413 RepID=UPI003FD0A96D